MRNPFRRLWPRVETHWLLARRAGVVGSVERGDGVRAVVVATVADAGMEALEAFAVASGFPAGWVAEMLAEGAVATLAVTDAGGVGMGWVTRRGFFIEEVGATLDPGGGAYLFGDFVTPAQRGRGIQRWLVAERLGGVGDACTIVHPANVASLRSYGREGFEVVGKFTRYSWGGRTWARCRGGVFECAAGDVIRARWG